MDYQLSIDPISLFSLLWFYNESGLIKGDMHLGLGTKLSEIVPHNSGGPLEKNNYPNLELEDLHFWGKMSGPSAVSKNKEE